LHFIPKAEIYFGFYKKNICKGCHMKIPRVYLAKIKESRQIATCSY
jgi:predicted  nucleic acid-binding Zn-ribbon protein